jgi:hypothetical protein
MGGPWRSCNWCKQCCCYLKEGPPGEFRWFCPLSFVPWSTAAWYGNLWLPALALAIAVLTLAGAGVFVLGEWMLRFSDFSPFLKPTALRHVGTISGALLFAVWVGHHSVKARNRGCLRFFLALLGAVFGLQLYMSYGIYRFTLVNDGMLAGRFVNTSTGGYANLALLQQPFGLMYAQRKCTLAVLPSPAGAAAGGAAAAAAPAAVGNSSNSTGVKGEAAAAGGGGNALRRLRGTAAAWGHTVTIAQGAGSPAAQASATRTAHDLATVVGGGGGTNATLLASRRLLTSADDGGGKKAGKEDGGKPAKTPTRPAAKPPARKATKPTTKAKKAGKEDGKKADKFAKKKAAKKAGSNEDGKKAGKKADQFAWPDGGGVKKGSAPLTAVLCTGGATFAEPKLRTSAARWFQDFVNVQVRGYA